MTGPVAAALAAFRAEADPEGWQALPFFREGHADAVAALVDARIAAGAQVLPAAEGVFRALALTPLDAVKVVILGQDPYPRPGDAHGLAFSFVGDGRMPPSLKVILAEMADDLGCERPARGDLTAWARQGVLLLNAALTDEVVAAVSAKRPAAVFMLWGGPARARAALVDRTKHLVIECGHPSPLNRNRDFAGTRPFSRANAWLAERGLGPVEWRL